METKISHIRIPEDVEFQMRKYQKKADLPNFSQAVICALRTFIKDHMEE